MQLEPLTDAEIAQLERWMSAARRDGRLPERVATALEQLLEERRYARAASYTLRMRHTDWALRRLIQPETGRAG